MTSTQSITARRYYFRPDEPSREKLPLLFRVAQRDINSLIRTDRDVAEALRELRLNDPSTRDAQLERDVLQETCKQEFARIREPGDRELKQMRGRTFASRKTEGHTEAYTAYKTRRREISAERAKLMKKFRASIDHDDRMQAALDTLEKPNQKDRAALLKVELTATKHSVTHDFNKYHINDYCQHGLKRARETSDAGVVEFRRFVRGYGTQLPTEGTLASGHSQTETTTRRTVAELRGGAVNRVIKRMAFPEQSAWDVSAPRAERKRQQMGEVDLLLMNQRIRGTMFFHQPIPDQHCVLDVRLSVEVRSGNVYYYVNLTLMDVEESRAKQRANSYEGQLAEFRALPEITDSSTREELKAMVKLCTGLKGKLARKLDRRDRDADPTPEMTILLGQRNLVESRLEEIAAVADKRRQAARAAKQADKEQTV